MAEVGVWMKQMDPPSTLRIKVLFGNGPDAILYSFFWNKANLNKAIETETW